MSKYKEILGFCKKLLVLFGMVLMFGNLNAQSDLVSWTSFQFHTKSYDGFVFTLKPTIRYDNDLSNFANFSLDFTVGKSFSKGWRVQYLYRHWWIDDGLDRTFWWFNLGKRIRLNDKWSFDNNLRWHIALDSQFKDPNFLRYLPSVLYKVSDKLTASIGSEIWIELDGINALQRLRHQAGVAWKFDEKWTFNFHYWAERSHGVDPYFLFHTLVSTLSYRI